MSREHRDRVVRNHAKLEHERIQSSMADGEFPEEHRQVQDDQEIVDEGRRETRLIVPKGIIQFAIC